MFIKGKEKIEGQELYINSEFITKIKKNNDSQYSVYLSDGEGFFVDSKEIKKVLNDN